jgi:hypothetical protein
VYIEFSCHTPFGLATVNFILNLTKDFVCKKISTFSFSLIAPHFTLQIQIKNIVLSFNRYIGYDTVLSAKSTLRTLGRFQTAYSWQK